MKEKIRAFTQQAICFLCTNNDAKYKELFEEQGFLTTELLFAIKSQKKEHLLAFSLLKAQHLSTSARSILINDFKLDEEVVDDTLIYNRFREMASIKSLLAHRQWEIAITKINKTAKHIKLCEEHVDNFTDMIRKADLIDLEATFKNVGKIALKANDPDIWYFFDANAPKDLLLHFARSSAYIKRIEKQDNRTPSVNLAKKLDGIWDFLKKIKS